MCRADDTECDLELVLYDDSVAKEQYASMVWML